MVGILRSTTRGLCLAAALFLLNCSGITYKFEYEGKDPALAQNWTEKDRQDFYHTSQGSQFLKYYWFLALERPRSQQLFAEDSLERFGYLQDPYAAAGNRPTQLPIGFVKDEGDGYIRGKKTRGPWIGLTCAACHTAQVTIGEKQHLIDGAPADADFHAFIKELGESLDSTAVNPVKFDLFAARVAGMGGTTPILEDLAHAAHDFNLIVQQNTPVHDWGLARMDAVALILNEVGYKQNPVSFNVRVPNAPVSYPFLWDTYQQPQVQWNGVSVAPLSRNTTEVMGAFATFDPQSPKRNSIDFGGLKELQTLVTNLRSPRWQDPRYGLPPVDAASAARGDSLYVVHCQTCHTVHDRELDLPDRIEIDLTALDSIRTDSSMAVDFIAHEILSADGDTLGPAEALSSTLVKVWRKGRLFSLLINAFFDERRGEKGRITEDLRVYKARPLDGIWATGPFLHNGSVRNVYDIMLPAGQRADRFCVGRRTVEADSLGFDSGLANCARDGFFVLDTSLPGNRNTGHDGVAYGTSGPDALTHKDRMDIIEFIKTE